MRMRGICRLLDMPGPFILLTKNYRCRWRERFRRYAGFEACSACLIPDIPGSRPAGLTICSGLASLWGCCVISPMSRMMSSGAGVACWFPGWAAARGRVLSRWGTGPIERCRWGTGPIAGGLMAASWLPHACLMAWLRRSNIRYIGTRRAALGLIAVSVAISTFALLGVGDLRGRGSAGRAGMQSGCSPHARLCPCPAASPGYSGRACERRPGKPHRRGAPLARGQDPAVRRGHGRRAPPRPHRRRI
jgi:hypothetical protein